MASLAQTQIEVPLPVKEAGEALVPILEEHGFSLVGGSRPGASKLVFAVGITGFRNAMRGSAKFTDTGSGSTIELGLDVAPGESKTPLDGLRNRRTLKKIAEQVAARVR